MKKILNVLNGLGSGGAEAFALNVMDVLDNKDYQVDFLIRSDKGNIYFDKAKNAGSNIFITASFPKNLFQNYRETKKFFKKNGNNYDYIHIHMNALVYVYPIIFAKKYSKAKIILHSHNTKSLTTSSKVVHRVNQKLFLKDNKDYIQLACSNNAGKWMFKNRFQPIFNSIDTKKFEFNPIIRKKLRSQFLIPDECIVFGNVGRFNFQKNHARLLDIFKAYNKINENSKLILIGDGNLQDEIENKVTELKLDEKVIFMGAVTNISDFYNMLDIFLMPSLYEGLPIALIEAQASGLPCIVSEEAITEEADITGLITFASLSSTNIRWVDMINSINTEKSRDKYYMVVEKNGFGKTTLENTMKEIYK